MSNNKLLKQTTMSIDFTEKELQEMLSNIKAGGTAEVMILVKKEIILR